MQGEGSQNICVSTWKVYSMLLCICNVRAEPQINRLLLQRPRGWSIKDVRRDGGHVGQMRTRVKALADVRKLVLFLLFHHVLQKLLFILYDLCHKEYNTGWH